MTMCVVTPLHSTHELHATAGDGPVVCWLRDEIAGCPRCWEAIAHWAVSLVAGDRAFHAGGREQAVGYVLSELYRTLMIK